MPISKRGLAQRPGGSRRLMAMYSSVRVGSGWSRLLAKAVKIISIGKQQGSGKCRENMLLRGV